MPPTPGTSNEFRREVFSGGRADVFEVCARPHPYAEKVGGDRAGCRLCAGCREPGRPHRSERCVVRAHVENTSDLPDPIRGSDIGSADERPSRRRCRRVKVKRNRPAARCLSPAIPASHERMSGEPHVKTQGGLLAGRRKTISTISLAPFSSEEREELVSEGVPQTPGKGA